MGHKGWNGLAVGLNRGSSNSAGMEVGNSAGYVILEVSVLNGGYRPCGSCPTWKVVQGQSPAGDFCLVSSDTTELKLTKEGGPFLNEVLQSTRSKNPIWTSMLSTFKPLVFTSLQESCLGVNSVRGGHDPAIGEMRTLKSKGCRVTSSIQLNDGVLSLEKKDQFKAPSVWFLKGHNRLQATVSDWWGPPMVDMAVQPDHVLCDTILVCMQEPNSVIEVAVVTVLERWPWNRSRVAGSRRGSSSRAAQESPSLRA